MNQELKNRIHDELKEFLNREPSENEIINAQTDSGIIVKVKERIKSENEHLLEERIKILENKVNKIKL
jgi:hypothetical protein